MNEKLATGLLDKVMKWSVDEAKQENIFLQILASSRYDDYKPFKTGMRFIESLARWLNQFDDNEKKIAYSLIRKNLVYISEKEIQHLVEISFQDHIRQYLIQKIAHDKKLAEWKIREIIDSKEYAVLLRQCLFLGLSDGSHIDIFRRNTPILSTEQVFRTHEITEQRAKDMLEELSKDLTKILGRKPTEKECKFKIIFLLDDFSASGISYIRKEDSDQKLHGKIARFYYDLMNQSEDDIEKQKTCPIPTSKLIDINDLEVCVLLYVITSQSFDYLKNEGKQLFGKIKFNVLSPYQLPNSIKIDESDNVLMTFLEKYKDDSIIDKHFKRGRHSKPYLGYDHCALPLILFHNTPNNSLPILWYEDDHPDRKFVGLFPRISRHN